MYISGKNKKNKGETVGSEKLRKDKHLWLPGIFVPVETVTANTSCIAVNGTEVIYVQYLQWCKPGRAGVHPLFMKNFAEFSWPKKKKLEKK